jgi:hypothetical protein
MKGRNAQALEWLNPRLLRGDGEGMVFSAA